MRKQVPTINHVRYSDHSRAGLPSLDHPAFSTGLKLSLDSVQQPHTYLATTTMPDTHTHHAPAG